MSSQLRALSSATRMIIGLARCDQDKLGHFEKASGRTSLVHTRAQCGKISVQEREGVDTISGRSRSRSHRPWLPEALTSRRSRAGLRNKEFLPRSKR
jgi:hypothetical protein